MTVETRDIDVGQSDHVVQFYTRDSELVAAVCPYLTGALETGGVAIVIATDKHRLAFEAQLASGGSSPGEARAEGRLILLDAAGTMARFMVDGQVDRPAFCETVGGLMREASAPGRAVHAYGEMVALLWNAGNVLAAIELETLWNELASELAFSLFCAYPAAAVSGSEHADALHQICHLHTSVLHPPAHSDRNAIGRGSATEVTGRFAAERDEPRCARHMCVAALREWGHEEALVEDAALVLSELATNAVVHADSRFSVVVRAEDSRLRIAVRDTSPLAATGDGNGFVAQTGHGLGLIDAIATRWGVEDTLDGKVVWAELQA